LWFAASFLEFVGVFSFSLSFGFSFLGVFSLAGSGRSFFLLCCLGLFCVVLFSVRTFFWFFQMPLLSFWFVGALYVAWVFFKWVCFLLEPFFCGVVIVDLAHLLSPVSSTTIPHTSTTGESAYVAKQCLR
jgi:hypothetical protein